MARIQTLVFIDIGTTGHPESCLTENSEIKITELSLVAVKSDQLMNKPVEELPRVIQKLTLCLNPQHPITTDGFNRTKLNNKLLQQEPVFDHQAFHLIKDFFRVLSKPICLIAHHGFIYDFPIVKKHIQDLGVESSFFEDLLCADSFHAFYHVMEQMDFNKDKVARGSTVKRSHPLHGDAMTIDFLNKPSIPRNPWEPGPRPNVSYKLREIYRRLKGIYPKNVNSAENRCFLLLEMLATRPRVAKRFIDWVNENTVQFSEFIPMNERNLFGPKMVKL